jgi:hypothetical protein
VCAETSGVLALQFFAQYKPSMASDLCISDLGDGWKSTRHGKIEWDFDLVNKIAKNWFAELPLTLKSVLADATTPFRLVKLAVKKSSVNYKDCEANVPRPNNLSICSNLQQFA